MPPPAGLIDICIVTSPTCGISDAGQKISAADTRQTRRQVGLLWAIRQALVVAAVYVATSSAGTGGTLFWALAGSAAGLYLVSYLLLGQRLADLEDDTGIGPSQPENLVYLLSYLSLVRPRPSRPPVPGTGARSPPPPHTRSPFSHWLPPASRRASRRASRSTGRWPTPTEREPGPKSPTHWRS